MSNYAALLLLTMMTITKSYADNKDLSHINEQGKLEVIPGEPGYKHVLHYRKLYEEKPFPDAVIYYYRNGVYRIISQGEDHYGLYHLQGQLSEQSYTIRYISSPSVDWGNKTAFHLLTFVNGDKDNIFIQNAITDKGEQIAQQNGTFTLAQHDDADPDWPDPK